MNGRLWLGFEGSQGTEVKQTAKTLLAEIRKAAAEAPRMYFAPLIWAVRCIRSQQSAINMPRPHDPEKIQSRSRTD